MQTNLFTNLYNVGHKFARTLDFLVSPVVFLGMRYWISEIFFLSGLRKLDKWESTLFLFRYEYKVPLLNPDFAAFSATAFELMCPVLLLTGLMTRLAAFPMLVMTAVIQFTYLDHQQHYVWALVLGLLILKGPDRFSLDCLIFKWLRKKTGNTHG